MSKDNRNIHRTPPVGGNLPAALQHPQLQTSPEALPPIWWAQTPSTSSPISQTRPARSISLPAVGQANKRRRSAAYRFFPRFGDRGEPYGLKVRENHEQRFEVPEGG